MIISEAVYLACALTSLMCAVLLLRGYRQERGRLLFWASMCFIGLTLNNVLLFVDLILLPQVDLFLWRTIPAVAGMVALLYGLIWEGR
ncbi:MAG TPA: DUF5985 family protein [Steroidobacteraceae bacterium]|nr:DUF5985 family protein [Steroidobacteraceae bacterium]